MSPSLNFCSTRGVGAAPSMLISGTNIIGCDDPRDDACMAFGCMCPGCTVADLSARRVGRRNELYSGARTLPCIQPVRAPRWRDMSPSSANPISSRAKLFGSGTGDTPNAEAVLRTER